MRSVIVISIAYILGIIMGLYSLYMALLFLPISFFIYKAYIKLFNDIDEKYLILVSIFIFGIFYSRFTLKSYKSKYNEKMICDSGIVLELCSSGDYYNKYIVKNSNKDKFLLYINNNIKLNEMDIIEFQR